MKDSLSLIRGVVAIVFALGGGSAVALDDQVESLQQPAWVLSSGERSAAFPGQKLERGDQVSTGESGKVWLRLAEGSRVKLGNSARLELDIEGMTNAAAASGGAGNAGEEGIYKAALDVLRGAFRFTTTELGERFQRSVDIQAGPVATIGIRGTDVWGRAGMDSSFVALIEGNISITRDDGSELALEKPLTVFQASTRNPKGKTQQVALEDVQKLAPETELDTGQGVLVEEGPYSVHLLSLQSRSAASSSEQAFRDNGYAATQTSVTVRGETWYRVSVNGFASLEDAQTFRSQARERGLSGSAWVGNNR